MQIATSFDDYSILVQLVQSADLVDVLTNDGPFTVFAPNNDAFYKLMDELGVTLEDILNIPTSTLTQILKYHLFYGAVLSSDLKTIDYETVNGQALSIDASKSTDYHGFDIEDVIGTEDVQHRGTETYLGNVEAQNGVCHDCDSLCLL